MANQKKKAIFLLVGSSFFFALMSVFVRLAGDLPSMQKMVFRNLISAAVAAGILLSSRESVHVPRQSVIPLAMRTICGLGGVFCNYYAIDHLMLASSNSLSKLSPFFAIIFAVIFLKERVSPGQLGCILLALAGSGFLIFPNMSTLGGAALIGLLGGVSSGGAHVALRALHREKQLSNSTIVFIFSAVSLVIVLIPALFIWEPMSTRQIIIMLLAGASCAGAQFCLTGAYQFAAPKDISIYDCTQILFSGIFGFLVFGQIPGFTSWIAYAFILAASVLLFLYNRKH